MSIYDTVLIDSTDVQTSTRVIDNRDGSYLGPEGRGDLLTYPGRDGNTNTDQPFGPFVFPFGVLLTGSSFTGLNDEYRLLRQLCKPGRTVTLTKRMAYTAGNEAYTATAKLLRITPNRRSPVTMRALVEFTVLDGLWYGSSATVSTGSVSVLGDVRTQRMVVTLSGAGTGAHTLTNSTNGWALTYTGSVATAVDIDVLAQTATQGASDVSGNLTWTRAMPFRLDPGTNSLSLSAGSASIAYYPAYL